MPNQNNEISCNLITPKWLSANLARLKELEDDWVTTRQGRWIKSQYLQDLPDKWALSSFAMIRATIVGYLIASRDPIEQTLSRVHKIVVDKKMYRRGIGCALMLDYFDRCSNHGIVDFELKAMADYSVANSFYRKLGYNLTGANIGNDGELRNIYKKSTAID
jgi:ribosomal protein S18 acetylase RimI-like enzyme